MVNENVTVRHLKETLSAWDFEVSVGDARYDVKLDKEYWRKLTKGVVPANKLVFHSFLFLLAREGKESILSSFNLKDINHYFPEYEKEIVGIVQGT